MRDRPDAGPEAPHSGVRHPEVDGERLLDGLGERGVVASLRRGWVRAAPHLYNTPEEIEQVAEAVREVLDSAKSPR